MAWPVDPPLYLAFLGVMAVMAITPGPANLFSIANGAERGVRAVPLAVAGMSCATLVWFGAAALGLGALIIAFPQAFRLIAVLGALYVIWLGLQAILAALRPAPTASPDHAPPVRAGRGAFLDGFAVQIANPKAVLFFSVVLPPFLDAARPAAPQLALFATATIGMDVMAMSAYGLGGAALALALRMAQPRFRRGFGLFTGLLLLAAAALILMRL